VVDTRDRLTVSTQLLTRNVNEV